jgi:hypothetical protein
VSGHVCKVVFVHDSDDDDDEGSVCVCVQKHMDQM